MGIGATGPILGGQNSPIQAGIQQATGEQFGVTCQVAKGFHLELSPHAAGGPKRLWFDVGEKVWPGMDEPDDITVDSVVEAFSNRQDLEVVVCHSGMMIFQLIIRSKAQPVA